jgi:hypothetical protein
MPMSAHWKYAPIVQSRRAVFTTTAAAVVGGVLGAATVWLSRPAPPSCSTLDNGMRACMPIYVVDPPLWLYGAFVVIGALLAGGMTLGYAFARRPRGR